MSSRSALRAAVAVAVAALALTACNADGSAGSGPTAAGTQAATTPAASATASAAAPDQAGTEPATAKPSTAKPGTGTSAPGGCRPDPPIPAGHKVVIVSKHATATRLYATDAAFECKQPDFGWWPTGSEKTYTVAADAKAALANSGNKQSVPLAKLVDHIAKCVDGATDTPTCDSGTKYEITLDSAGKVTALSEVWGP